MRCVQVTGPTIQHPRKQSPVDPPPSVETSGKSKRRPPSQLAALSRAPGERQSTDARRPIAAPPPHVGPAHTASGRPRARRAAGDGDRLSLLSSHDYPAIIGSQVAPGQATAPPPLPPSPPAAGRQPAVKRLCGRRADPPPRKK